MSFQQTFLRGVSADLTLASITAAASYLLFGPVNINLADEGFLWYGVLRTLAGEVPLRDFQSYDPARYYVCAIGAWLFGTGILGLRASLAVVQGAGLFFGFRVIRRATAHPIALITASAVLVAWMFPMHKIFEHAIAMLGVWIGVRLIEAPSARRIFQAGAFVGAAAWLGRNHALYSFTASIGLLALLFRAGVLPPWRRVLGAFGLGGMAGALPLWVMLLAVPGFARALLESIVFNITTAVNLPLPYPWPWMFDPLGKPGFAGFVEAATAAAFALPLAAYPAAILLAFRTRPDQLARRAPLIASAFVGIFFMHHASVRSDIWHLAQAIHPLLLLVLTLPASLSAGTVARVGVPALTLAWTLIVALGTNPQYMEHRPEFPVTFVPYTVGNDVLRIPSFQAGELANIEAAVRTHTAPADPMFIAPTRPTFYPMFGKQSPDWWLYFLFPASRETQDRTIARLEQAQVRWALIVDEAIDGRDELRFRNSHSHVWDYLTRVFERQPDARLPPNYSLLRRRGAAMTAAAP